MPPAWKIDAVNGDQIAGGGAGSLAAVAGYPHLTVPMGLVKGLPVGLSFIGPKWSEALLLSLGYAYEQARGPFPAPKFYRSIEESAGDRALPRAGAALGAACRLGSQSSAVLVCGRAARRRPIRNHLAEFQPRPVSKDPPGGGAKSSGATPAPGDPAVTHS